MIVAVDTTLLIWGVKKAASDENAEAMIPIATAIFQHFTSEHIQVCVPTQVLGEYLAGFPNEKRAAGLAELAKFRTADLDIPAARIMADLWHAKAICADVRKDFGKDRQTVKADVNVIASAVQHGADYLVCHDRGMTALAQGRIIVKDIRAYFEETVAPAIQATREATERAARSARQQDLFGESTADGT